MREFLHKASKLYYEGSPILSDEEFDLLAQKHHYNAVGYTVTDAVPHTFQMFSLQKCFDLNDAPADVIKSQYIVTPKLDGAAVSILYVNGELQLALTRGDGVQGRYITEKMRHLVPSSIPMKQLVQITGEVVAPSSIPNARNYASGALNLKDLKEFETRNITFVAYGAEGLGFDNWTDAMNYLNLNGFKEVTRFDHESYPTDGYVYRVNSFQHFHGLGYTSSHPRGAFALKEQAEGVVTTLQDVVWQVGKSGVVSPVAILLPVTIGDAVVARATLHNIEYIRDLNLEIGCQVEVIRSGEIIPRVVRRVE
jgi:NAD-dependent DNA ligase